MFNDFLKLLSVLALLGFGLANPVDAKPSDEYLLQVALQTVKYKEEAHFRADVKRYMLASREDREKMKAGGGISIPIAEAIFKISGDYKKAKEFTELLLHDEKRAWEHDVYREMQFTFLDKDAVKAYEAIRLSEIAAEKNRGVRLSVEAVGDKHVVATVHYLPQMDGSLKTLRVTGVHAVGLKPASPPKLVEKAELSQYSGLTTTYERLDPEGPCSLTVTFDRSLPLHETLGGKPKIKPEPSPVAGQFLFQDVQDAPVALKCTATDGKLDQIEITNYCGTVWKGTFDRDSKVLTIIGPRDQPVVGHLLPTGVILITPPGGPGQRFFWNRPGTPRTSFPW